MANYLSESPIFIGNIKSPVLASNIKKAQFSLATSKAQFTLATSKTQFSLVISKVQFTLARFYQKPENINAWQKISCLFHLKDEQCFLNITMAKNHSNHFIKVQQKVILKIMIFISYYKPMNVWSSFTITTSIFGAHGNYSIPQAHHLNYDVIIRNHEHYLWCGIHHFQK